MCSLQVPALLPCHPLLQLLVRRPLRHPPPIVQLLQLPHLLHQQPQLQLLRPRSRLQAPRDLFPPLHEDHGDGDHFSLESYSLLELLQSLTSFSGSTKPEPIAIITLCEALAISFLAISYTVRIIAKA